MRGLLTALTLASLLACRAGSALAAPVPAHSSTATKVLTQNIVLKDAGQRLDIDLSFPQLQAESGGAQTFNRLIRSLIDPRLTGFKKDAAEAMTWLRGASKAEAEAYAGVDNSFYSEFEIRLQDTRLLSVALTTAYLVIGNAHASHERLTVNYDLTRHRSLQLADLFKPGSAYLPALAKICQAELLRRAKAENLAIDDFIQEGTAPKAANYAAFSLTPKALIIDFQEYQAGAYVEGIKEVSIPYASLKSLLNPAGPLAAYAK